MITQTKLKGIYSEGKRLFTKNLVLGKTVYDERIISMKGEEFREWNPKKSKLAAAIVKGISQIGIMPGKSVLYLGCSTGTTCSHVSDIVGSQGILIGVDIAPRVMREFYFLSKERPNIVPIMADAAQPFPITVPLVDVVFQDIAQRNQVAIFLNNCKRYLKQGGFGLLSVKARSIDVTQRPKELFQQVRKELEKAYTVVDARELAPFELDHCLFVVKKLD